MIVCGGTYPRGDTRPISGYRWGAEGLRPWPCVGQKKSKNTYPFGITPSILLPSQGQEVNAHLLVLKPLCLFTWSTNKFYPANQIDCEGNTLFMIRTDQTCAKSYTLFRREVKKPNLVKRHISVEAIWGSTSGNDNQNLPFILSQVARPFLQDPCNWREQAWLLLCEH